MGTTLKKCDLCGILLRHSNHSRVLGGVELHFCCKGCLMVYTMLMEATDSPDPARFKESDLYRRCVAAGVVPATETDVAPDAELGADAVPTSPIKKPEHDSLSLHLKVDGMWCPACSWVIQRVLGRLDGVTEVICDFSTDRLVCRYDPVRVDPGAVVKTVNGLGYQASAGNEHVDRSAWQGELVRLLITAFLSVNVMMLSWSLYSGFFTSLSVNDIRFISWPIVVMASGVMMYGGGPLFRKAWRGLRAGAPGMEALVCLGAGSAYLFSLYNFRVGSWHLYFDTASMLITLVLLGKLLEARAKARVRRDLEGFLALQPKKVRLCSDQFPQGRFVALAQLTPGDMFRVKADEMVPADGRVTAGSGLMDESAVTGESRPRTIGAGQAITSGSRLIKGDVTVSAIRVGDDALLGQMIAVVESGLYRQLPMESRTDRWLALFVPVMVGLAAVTLLVGHGLGLVWEQAFVRALTVLVIACPCALGIAIPLARIAGISCAGRKGLLVRDFEAFERAGAIDCAVFDKTGTLTHGRWSLEQLVVCGKMGEHEVLAVAAGLEKAVDHAVARAVLAHASKMMVKPACIEDVQISENGAEGRYQGRCVKIGTWDFLGLERHPEMDGALFNSPLSKVFMSVAGEVCAVLGFGDRIRESAPATIRQLKRRGFGLHLISGDTRAVTVSVGRQIGIENVQGRLLPLEKADYVGRLQAAGDCVAMVGDGINDAPALAASNLSIAVHSDASLAQQAADVTLMRGDPEQLADFLGLAEQVNAKVAQNLCCASIYNLIGIPVAMSGWLNPLVAVIAMLLSSLTVIGNTLLLVRKR